MDIPVVLSKKYIGAEWQMTGEDYADLIWMSDTDKPTEAQLLALWPEVQLEVANDIQSKLDTKAALLERLGITADEAKLLLG